MELQSLREQLSHLDRDLLNLVARRLDLVAKIGRAKQQTGQPTRDFSQERIVIERARRCAADLNLPPDLAEEILLSLIRSSLTVQERDRVAHGGPGAGLRALVIGGNGKMGRWFVRFLGSQGYRITVADPTGSPHGFEHACDWRTLVLDHDWILVTAPLRASADILLELARRKPAGIVFDVGSLKTPLRKGLNACVEAGCRVTSIHPMFGPSTELLSRRHVIFVDLGVPEATQAARGLFEATMAIQVEMDMASHDRLIAFVLGLSHAVNLVFASALAGSGRDAAALAQLSSTTYDEQLRVAGRVVEENPHLYYEIQSLNEFGGESLAALEKAAIQLRKSVRTGDEAGFVEMMTDARDYLVGARSSRGW